MCLNRGGQVRDGRDISFSGNQSPVKKFYDVNYGVVKGQENADPYHGTCLRTVVMIYTSMAAGTDHLDSRALVLLAPALLPRGLMP